VLCVVYLRSFSVTHTIQQECPQRGSRVVFGSCSSLDRLAQNTLVMKFRIVFWDVLRCKIIVDRRMLMMEAARTSETSVDNYFTRQYIPEDNSELHTRRRENLKSHIVKQGKAVPLNAMEALGGRRGIAPTHSRPRH
jgi:hypothetical protein